MGMDQIVMELGVHGDIHMSLVKDDSILSLPFIWTMISRCQGAKSFHHQTVVVISKSDSV